MLFWLFLRLLCCCQSMRSPGAGLKGWGGAGQLPLGRWGTESGFGPGSSALTLRPSSQGSEWHHEQLAWGCLEATVSPKETRGNLSPSLLVTRPTAPVDPRRLEELFALLSNQHFCQTGWCSEMEARCLRLCHSEVSASEQSTCPSSLEGPTGGICHLRGGTNATLRQGTDPESRSHQREAGAGGQWECPLSPGRSFCPLLVVRQL